jgi:hypothetical protein
MEDGDASGYRVRLVRSAEGDRLYLEWTNGPLLGPSLAEDLKIDPSTSRVSFTIQVNAIPPYDHDPYTGTITSKSMVLNGRRLPRVKNAYAELRACRF